MDAAAAGVEAFNRTLAADQVRDQVAAPIADRETVEQLQARFHALQAKAASGARGSVQARRELRTVRHELMRHGIV